MSTFDFQISKFHKMKPPEIANALIKIRFADAIDVINSFELDQAAAIIKNLPNEYAVELFDRPELNRASELLNLLSIKQMIVLLDSMSADQATDVFQELNLKTQSKLLEYLAPETQKALKSLIYYPDETAGSLMTTEFIAVPYTWTVNRTLQYIREVERSRETIYAIYIIEPRSSTLMRAISLRHLIRVDPNKTVFEISTQREPITISPYTKKEELAVLFRRYDLLAVPVIDKKNKIIGIVTVDDVLDSMTEDMNKDTQKFGGMEALDNPYMAIGFFQFLQKRGIWLSILFLSEMLTTSAMQHYSVDLERAVVLSLFIPLIMSSGGNSGSQATSLIIRALALQEIGLKDWWRILLREIPMGVALGTMLGCIGVIRILIWQKTGFYDYGAHWILLSFTIFVALIGIVTWGCLAGSMLPLLLKLCRIDPATASAPFIATLVDVTGIVIYFSVAALLLRGTVL